MKYRYAFLLFLAGFLLQSTIMNQVAILGVAPNLTLCLVILLAFLYKGNAALLFGTLFGLLQDLCFGEIIGIAPLCYIATVLFIEIVKQYWVRDNVLSIFLVCVTGTGLYYLLYWGVQALFTEYYSFLSMAALLPVLLPLHFVVMLLFYLVIGRRAIRHPQDKYLRGV